MMRRFVFPNLINFLVALLRTGWAQVCRYEILARRDDVEDRLDKCDWCIHRTQSDQCEICTCFIHAKVLLNPESCPKGRWKAVWRKRA